MAMTRTVERDERQQAAAAWAVYASPLGPLLLVARDQALVELRFADGDTLDERPDDGDEDPTHEVLAATIAQLDEYFAGSRREFDLPLAPRGSDFQQQAWAALLTIPFGETISYGEQARRLGDPRKARAVGGANGRNPIPIIVPCHRVIGADGSLTGFSAGMSRKVWLLEHEQPADR